MTIAYYILLLPCFIYELTFISNPKRYRIAREKMKLLKYKEYSSSQQSFVWCQFIYMVLVIVGLFTFQYPAFILLLILSVIPKKWLVMDLIDSVLSASILLFVIINKFHIHWHYDYLYQLLNK
jgi:hypothetical protein